MSGRAWTISSGDAQVTIGADGQWLSVTEGPTSWLAAAGQAWAMTVQAPSTASVLGRHRAVNVAGPPQVTATADSVRLRFADLQVEGQPVALELTVQVTAAAEGFHVTFQVANRTADWTVRELRGPFLPVSLAAAPGLLWPQGAGERIADPSRLRQRQAPYPASLFMPWTAVDAGDQGFYFGVHDDTLRTMQLAADGLATPGAVTLNAVQHPFCGPGETWDSPPAVLRPYRGTWHEAARGYRRWAETWWAPCVRPAWLTEATGWQLVILKQQNGEIHWPYADLDRAIELGRETGLNILGLFGWTEGGHDRRYPIYQADEAMGGEAALRAAIERAHQAGQKVILYTNGQLRDLQTEWYAAHGRQTAAVSERGETYGETWHKYRDAPPRPMSYGCQSSPGWLDTLSGLAHRVHALGADGLIFDQLGSAQPPFCFSREHGHASPALATGPGVDALLRRVQQELQAVDPDFIVLVEHVTDALNQLVDLTHGCGIGFDPHGAGFPELLRFTFPELLATQRHPTPVLDRRTANWACLYGFLFEVEYRYWPDRLYIDQGVRPEVTAYERIGSPPNSDLMRALDPRAASADLRQVAEFATRHRAVLREGRFQDTLGFCCDNPRVRAKAYSTAGSLGVLVWNPGDEPETVRVEVAGATLAEVDAPAGPPADVAAPLPPNSLRLYRFQRG